MQMSDVIGFILEKIPAGVIVLDRSMKVRFSNRQASKFLQRYELPTEVINISKRIFGASGRASLKDLFPGEIHLAKKYDGSPSNWLFRIHILEGTDTLVVVFILEEAVSGKLDLNKARQRFGLTRRETDVVRRVLDGLRNAEIADDLEITEQTVKDHLSNIYVKIGVENRFGLASALLTLPDLTAG